MDQIKQLDKLKAQIAEVYSLREQLKQAMSDGEILAHQGFKQLNKLDGELSALDTEFKQLWDLKH